MSGLDPTITGALIAGAFAVVGFGASAITTRATLRANRAAAQDQRLWDKRAPLYEQLMAAAQAVYDTAQDAKGTPGPDTYSVDVHGLRAGDIYRDAAQVLSDRATQVYAYASRRVVQSHSILHGFLTGSIRPGLPDQVMDAAENLLEQLRSELQPPEIREGRFHRTPKYLRRTARRIRWWKIIRAITKVIRRPTTAANQPGGGGPARGSTRPPMAG